jgi:hypothetical protein
MAEGTAHDRLYHGPFVDAALLVTKMAPPCGERCFSLI